MAEQMFPDVFAYTNTSKQDLQMSSFYFKSTPPSPKPCAASSKNQAPLSYTPHPQYTPDRLVFDKGGACSATTTTPVKPVQLPPSRRVVKLTIVPPVATLAVGVCLALNVVLCLLVPAGMSPILATMWGSFLYLWLLVTFMQLVSHSVYMCTHTAVAFTLFHLLVVVATAVLIPRSLFARWYWIEACLSVVIATHQCLLSALVYTQVTNITIYIISVFLLALGPMTQLVQLDPSNEETFHTGCVYSVITISTLYVCALFNSHGAVLVDATVGACPTAWQSQE
jgi:hypothetical protein